MSNEEILLRKRKIFFWGFLIQVIFLGIFLLGFAWALADVSDIVRVYLPINKFSILLMSYGLMGYLLTGRTVKKLVEKVVLDEQK